MSDSFPPIFKNTDGVAQQYGGEHTLTWDFTSATGNPMELQVSGSTYFTFDRNGAMALESNITWNSDSGGDIGAQYDYRPDNANVATKVAVGAISGTGDGSSLTLNRLTLGHGNVDKYVDAEQGLVFTPFIRYNAVNARWEYSDDGVTDYPFGLVFGAVSWDTIYAVDKSLDINSTTLTWTQTSTTDSAFAILRNLASANTDSPIVIIEQQNAGDDQAPIAIGQNATTISALDIYEGTVAAGTRRFNFIAEGQLGIVTNSALAAAAISVEQADEDEPFVLATGTAAADASKNVSTANNPTADMIRVQVDGGGGAATRWMPAYSSHVLPVDTWDAIYAGDKHLDINGAVLQFEQTNTSDYAFELFRNLAAASTDSPIVYIHNDNSGDDQSALYVAGGIGNVTGGVDIVQVGATSSGMTGGTEELRGVASTVTANASDAGGTWLSSFYADATTAGSSEAYGLYVTSNVDYSVYANSPVYITDNTATNTPLEVNQDDAGGVICIMHDTASNNTLEYYGSGNLISTHALSGPAILDHASFDTTSGGIVGGSIGIVKSTFNGNAGDVVGAVIDLFKANYNKNSSPLTDVRGFYADSDLDYGFWMEATGNFTIGSTTPFIDFDGNPQAAAAGNISTDMAGTADMLRVDVEGNTRWIPAYNATTIGGVDAWDDIYAVDPNSNVLTVSNADDPFEIDQTSASGSGFKVGRSTAISSAVDTDNLIYVDNSLTGGDSGALYITHGSGDSGAETYAVTINLVDTLYNRGMLISQATTAETDLDKYMFRIEDEGNERYTFRRDGTSYQKTSGNDANASVAVFEQQDNAEDGIELLGGGSNTNTGIYIDRNFGKGIDSEGPVYIKSTPLAAYNGLYLEQHSSEPPFLLKSSYSSVQHLFEMNYDSTLLAYFDYHGQLVIDTGDVYGSLIGGGMTDTVASFTTSSGNLDGSSYKLRGVYVSLTGDPSDSNDLEMTGAYFTYTAAGGSNDPRAIKISDEWDYGIHSLSPNYMETGAGSIALQCNQTASGDILSLTTSGSDRLVVDYTGAEVHTPSSPTASYNAYDLTLSSGGLGDSTSMRGLEVSLAGNAGDNATGTSIYGAYFDFTANSTSVPTIQAIYIDSNWDHGLYSDSPAYIESGSSTVSALVVNQTTTPNILDLQESATSRLSVDNTGATVITGSDTIPDFALALVLDSAGNNNTVPFIQFKGISDTDDSDNISTAGSGSFTHAGAVKVDINGTEYWMIYYTYSA